MRRKPGSGDGLSGMGSGRLRHADFSARGLQRCHIFERLAEVKRTEADLRIVLLAWPTKELTFLTHSYEVGVDAYLESTTSQEGFRQSLDYVVSGE
jgi:hypothetical protein